MNWNRLSVDPAIQKMFPKAREDGVKTVWDRYEEQQPQCGFGLLGICCRNCVQGPCRINPFGEPQQGVCGAGADLIVARNLARAVTGGVASHVVHAFEALETLSGVAEGKLEGYAIKDTAKLKAVAKKLGIETEGKDDRELAGEVSRVALGDFANTGSSPPRWLLACATPERVETWSKLGILPRNPDREIREIMHQTTMGVDSDPVNLLLATARMGLVDGYMGLHLATDIQDILFGTPTPVTSEANLGVLQESKVNIIVHGHVPLLSEKIVEWARKMEEEAKAAGAEGIQVAGICCTGNEVLMRQGIPLASNFLGQEMVITTGAVDLVVVDVQCIMPALAQLVECYHTQLVTTMPVAKIPGVRHIPFNLKTADEDARGIIRLAIEAYGKRDKNKVYIPPVKSSLMAGFSVEAIVEALKTVDRENPLKPLVDNMAQGNILGAVATVGCNNSRVTHDSFHLQLVEKLIKENILVVATGCSAHALAKAGFMSPEATEKFAGEGLKAVLTALGNAAGLGKPLPPVLHMGSCVDNSRIGDLLAVLAGYLQVPIKDLPVAASAPEFQHEKALSIGTWAVALGVFTHLGVVPPVLGSKTVAETLTSGLEELVGGKFYVETDPAKAAEGILAHIRTKRQKLGLK